MDDHTPDTVGVDISKAHLDLHRRSTGESARLANDADGFEELAAWVGDPAVLVVYESTGPWHRDLEERLAGRLALARVNPLRARRFAQAMGEEAKTDARTLAAMGAAMAVRRVEPRSQPQRDLDELVTARDALVKDRTAALNREKHARHPLLRRQLKNRLAQIGRQIKALDDQIARTTAEDAGLSRRMEVLTSIAGVGRVVAAGLVADMPELGRVDGKAAASLVGVAPWTRESGQWKGRRFIRGGRARPRRLLYMAAVSALRCNPDMARKYAELRARGKPPKVALTAVMRKLAVLANVLLKQDRLWTPEPGAVEPRPGARFPSTGRPSASAEGASSDRSRGRRPAASGNRRRAGGRTDRMRTPTRSPSKRAVERNGRSSQMGCATRRKPPLDNMDTHFALDSW